MKNVLLSLLRPIVKKGRGTGSASWGELIKNDSTLWSRSRQAAQQGQRVLVATSMGCFNHAVHLESVLAVALTLRGANVEILLCDGFLPCCQMTKISNVLPDDLLGQEHTPRCARCHREGKAMFEQIGLPIRWYGQLVTQDAHQKIERLVRETPAKDIADYTYEGLAVGEHALAGALRYYARGDLNEGPHAERILRRYLKASLQTVFAVEELLARNRYEVAVFNHGIYVPQGLIGEVCRKRGVRVVNWNPSYRRQTFIFSHEDSYHHTMITEPVSEWENIEWTDERQKTTLDYLRSRWHGTEDWIWFHEKPVENIDRIAREMGIDFSKPCIGMLTSVMWDAQLHYRSNAFKNMLDWTMRTIDYFSKRSDLQLIIRVHPAEVRGLVPSRQKLVEEIHAKFPRLPDNTFVIPPESRTSTYAVMEKCNCVIIYNTKTGIEISSMGIPVIVAGEAWIRGKGFSIDACSPEAYFKILDTLPLSAGLSEEKLERSQKYAYHFFFRRMIELPFIISPKKHEFALDLRRIQDLLPGKYRGLDVICDGISMNKSFVMQEHLPSNSEATQQLRS